MVIPFSVSQFATTVFTLSETCRDVLCPGSSTCVVDQTNNAYCVTCNRICPEVTSPEQYLCGNDGIIYASACHLRRATCLLGRSIGVAYEGKCISKSSTGQHLVAPHGIISVLSSSAVVQHWCLCQHSSEELVWECVCLVVAYVFSRIDRHLIVSWCWQSDTTWEKGKEKGEWVQQRSARGCGAVFHLNIFESDGLSNGMESISRCYLRHCFHFQSTRCNILKQDFTSRPSIWPSLKSPIIIQLKISPMAYSPCPSRGQVVWGHPVQRWEKVPVGRSDEPGPLLAVWRDLPREQDGWGGVCQRQHHLPQRMCHETGRLLYGSSAGDQARGILQL